jgi:hypothetical protein
MTTVYRWWSWLVPLAIVVQVAFAGFGAFDIANKVEDGTVDEDSFQDSWDPHAGFGYLVVLTGLILLVIALIARPGRRRVWRAAIIAGLLVVQVVLAWIGEGVPALGFLHPVNALVLFALTGWNAWEAWRMPLERESMAPATM